MVQMSGRSGRGGKPLSRRISGRPADSRRLPVVRAIEMRVVRPEWRLWKTDETHPLFITRQNVPIHSKYLRLSQMVSTDKFYLVSFGPNFSFEFKPFLHFFQVDYQVDDTDTLTLWSRLWSRLWSEWMREMWQLTLKPRTLSSDVWTRSMQILIRSFKERTSLLYQVACQVD